MEAVSVALQMVASPQVLLVVIGASLFGLFVGAVPGLTATMATALLVPLTFFMPPIAAVAAMVSATAMAIFAGDIPGCLLWRSAPAWCSRPSAGSSAPRC